MENADIETLRKALLETVYAGAFSGMPAMMLDAERVKYADEAELIKLARDYGLIR